MANTVQMQAMQEQSQTNVMLNQLPQQQRAQIESAVNNYRQTLVTQGYSADVIQTYVWTYYTRCVQTLFQNQAAKDQNGLPPAPPPAPAAKPSSAPLVSQAPMPSTSPSMVQAHNSHEEETRFDPELGKLVTFDEMVRLNAAKGRPAGASYWESLQVQALQQSAVQQRQQAIPLQQRQHQMHMQFQQTHQLQQQQQQHQRSFGPKVVAPPFQSAMMGGSSDWSSEETGAWNSEYGHAATSPGVSVGSAGMQDFDASTPSKCSSGGDWDGSQGANSSASIFSQPSPLAKAAAGNPTMMGMLGSSSKAPAMASSRPIGPWKRPPVPPAAPVVNQAGANESVPNGVPSAGVRFPLMAPRPMGNIRPTTPQMRLQMQQAHQQGGSQWGQARAPGFGAPGRPKAVMGKAPPGGAMGGGANRPGPQFPPALQKWLQRLFAHQTQSGETDLALQKATHAYLRNWVQQWVKTGELWQRNWDVAPLPTADEIRANLPPGTLVAANNAVGTSAPSQGVPGAPRIVMPPAWAKNNSDAATPTEAGQTGFSGPGVPSKRPETRERSRSRSAIRRTRRSGSRRRRRESSSSSNSSQSKRSRSRGNNDRDDESSESPVRDSKGKGKSTGTPGCRWCALGECWGCPGTRKKKVQGLGQDLKRASPEEARQQIRKFLDERVQNGDGQARHKDLSDALHNTLGVNGKRFRSLFNQTLAQYCYSLQEKGGVLPVSQNEGGIHKPKVISQGEMEMRAQRAARFQTHLQVERAPVAMVSFNDGGVASVNGGPLVGALNDMCSREEAREREMTRQLDKLEWKKGTDPRNPEVNLALATKKYQRSSADKAYRSQDVRNLDACWRTMEYLMTEILDFDKNPKPQFAVQSIPYIEVYSYLRDRTRSCRVDLHLQQPRSTAQRTFVETHECCLRFEMLSLFLLQGEAGGSTEKYDEKLGLKAISQTIEPLLNSYQAVRDKQLAKSILAEAMGELAFDEPDAEQEYVSPFEPAIHRFIILLLSSFSPDELLTHLAKLSREILSHPHVGFATQAYAAFQTDDYVRFLRLYRTADFCTSVAMSGLADLARLRALWLLVRTYCQPVGDKLPLAKLKNLLAFAGDSHARSFLAFHGVKVEADGKVILPKKGTPEALQHPLLTGPNRLPEKCEYPKGADSMLVSKFEALGLSRADIVFGSADPLAEVEVVAEDGELPTGSGEETTPAPEAAAVEGEKAPNPNEAVDTGEAAADAKDA